MRKAKLLETQHAGESANRIEAWSNPRRRDQLKARRLAGIFMNALIQVDITKFPRTGHQNARRGSDPSFLQEVVHQAFAKLDLQRFRQPPLRDVEYEQRSCDQEHTSSKKK